MNGKQRYYAHLEKQKAAEDSLSAPDHRSHSSIEEVYIDIGLRAFAAFQNCLDWVGNLSRVSADRQTSQETSVHTPASPEIIDMLTGIQEQLDRLETAVANLESGMRRIDKYTLDAFRQLSELEQAGVGHHTSESTPHRRLAKEDAIRIAVTAARRMEEQGFPISLAAVAREAGLKYGQIVYAFGNKENFLAHLREMKDDEEKDADTEVAASAERIASSR
ncbi:MAG: hypothetical protein ACOYEP_00715 [Limnochordia bacterium]|jgi:hypothetical protein